MPSEIRKYIPNLIPLPGTDNKFAALGLILVSSGTVGFSYFSPALSKPVVVAWLIFGVLPKPRRENLAHWTAYAHWST